MIIVSTLFIIATTLISVFLNKSFPTTALSDLGSTSNISLIFNLGIAVNGILVFIWLKTVLKKTYFINRFQKIVISLHPIAFFLLGIIPTYKYNFIHWMFAYTYFFSVLYFQFIIRNKFRINTTFFLMFEIAIAGIGLANQNFYLISESLVFLTISMWQYLLSRQILKSL